MGSITKRIKRNIATIFRPGMNADVVLVINKRSGRRLLSTKVLNEQEIEDAGLDTVLADLVVEWILSCGTRLQFERVSPGTPYVITKIDGEGEGWPYAPVEDNTSDSDRDNEHTD